MPLPGARPLTSLGGSLSAGPDFTEAAMPSQGSTNERGYGRRHKQLKEHWRPYVEAGLVACWRCDQLIPPDAPWDLGHDDHDRTVYRGPEHAGCNRSAARTKAARSRPAEGHPNRRRPS